jgi:integrase
MAEPKSKVSKLSLETEAESRLNTIESQIAELRSLILENGRFLHNISKKGAPESGFEPESEPRQLRDNGSRFQALGANISTAELNSPRQETLATLEFKYTKKELDSFLAWRTAGLSHKSSVWIFKAGDVFWKHTRGTISKTSLDQLRASLFKKYDDYYAQSKVLNFTKGFLKYQAKLTLDPRYLAFDMFLEKPRVRKVKKKMTARVVTKEDIEHVLAVIKAEMLKGSIDEERARQFVGVVLFGAFTGQRPYSTIAQLRVEQFRDALKLEKPVVHVEPAQDKIRMEHYVPLHPQLAGAMEVLCDGREGSKYVFILESFRKWLQKLRIPLAKCSSYFVTSDLRKFAEQHGDVVGWNESNRAYVLTHGVRGIEWSNYRHPLPEHVYAVYMQYWRTVQFDLR